MQIWRIANNANQKLTIFLTITLLFFYFVSYANANGLIDSDWDGVPDDDEINIYMTDPESTDTDLDGYSDWVELISGFSPHNPAPVIFLEPNATQYV